MTSTSTHQQSLGNARSETHPPMLKRGSYVSWSSQFMRYIERKRDTWKFLKRSIEEDYYVTLPPSVADYDDDYQGEPICDDQEDSLTTAMMLHVQMLGMVVDMQEGHLVLKGSLLIMEMFKRRLGKETYREFYELRPLHEMLRIFNDKTVMLKATME
uniref:Uncharacterized protein n=1 Tax=Tanacetum cinerariifolium TaxID=118510 RepID=A0A699HHH3_TANCI|nr:hypothetical protein [Tanacetum cinerariifolium]